MQATFTKLRTGQWGIRVKGTKPEPGQTVQVERRDGRQETVTLGSILWSEKDLYLCHIQKEVKVDPAAQPSVVSPVSASPEKETAVVPRKPLCLPDRTLVELTSAQGALSEHKIELVQEKLQTLRRLQQPEDIVRPLSELFVSFNSGRMEANWTTPGESERNYLLMRTGASQLGSEVLPSRFFPGLRQLARIDMGGAHLATGTWNKFASKSNKPRLVRTQRARDEDGQVRWVVRSCHSSSYGPYDNLELVEDIIAHAGEFSSLPVISCHVTDTGMRIRFCALDMTLAAFAHLSDDALMNEPIPMIEVWNSEVGKRRVGMRAGLYRTVSATGLTCWSDKQEYGWIHRGKSTRIAKGVRGAFEALMETAAEVIEVYKGAMNITIDDPEAYLVAVLTRHAAPEALVKAAKVTLKDPTVSSMDTLAGVVDAIALAAQHTSDLYQQEEGERTASQVLITGYRRATSQQVTVLKAEEV